MHLTTAELEQRGRDNPGRFKDLAYRQPEKPCDEHPNWEANDCHWCRQARTGAFTASYRMSVEEKGKLFRQTGVNFDDHAHYKRWCAANGFRDLERGEPQDVWRREADERAEAGLAPENSYQERAESARQEKRLAILEQAR